MMDGFGGHGWGMDWWWIIGLIIVIAVILIVVKSMNRSAGSSQSPGKSALD